uniref:Methyltransferase domain-containing protein n=1 Tax=Hordeum vulgare subsp. vulgare TaxID=112509 RepID=A0A8I6YFV2_HORVV
MADNITPCTASSYLDPSYWDGRFDKEEHYEWFKDFSHFRHLLAPLLSPSLLQVLEVGCGNSRIGDELLREGVAGGITRINLSLVAVQRMRDRLAEQGASGVGVVVADMVDLPFESESFDLVIEKGTMLCYA